MHTLNFRSFLWFTTGVVLTITSIATFGAWRASAAATPGESTYVPVAPCRLFDTRPVAAIADSDTTPLGAEETRTQQVTGAVGNCDLPTDASAVAFNVTILKPTAQGFLALFPADEETVPVVSNLNWIAGQPATPNKVDVKLSPTGEIKLYNSAGTVEVFADVVGYYTSATVEQLVSDVAALQAAVTALQTDTIPSGETVTGISNIEGVVNDAPSGADGLIAHYVELPAPVERLGGNVVIAPNDAFPLGTSDLCTGDFTNPTAPSGFVCVYAQGLLNVNGAAAIVAAGPAERTTDRSFLVTAKTSGTNGDRALMQFSWAYTAP